LLYSYSVIIVFLKCVDSEKTFFHVSWLIIVIQDSSVSIDGLDDQSSVPGRGIDEIFPPCHHGQAGSEAHPASYPMSTRGSFPGGKVANAWSRPLISI
jgi:hypothetical protein